MGLMPLADFHLCRSSYLHLPTSGLEPQQLHLNKRRQGLAVNTQLWGPPLSSASDMLFIGGGENSSSTDRRLKGYAVVWSLTPAEAVWDADLLKGRARGPCECLAIDPNGTYPNEDTRTSVYSLPFNSTAHRIAVISQSTPSTHMLDMIDIRRGARPIFHQELPHFKPSSSSNDSEILSCAFSPDGVYLATARDDNEAHVWDSRFMNRSKKPLRILKHGARLTKHQYGVTGMAWLAHEGSSSTPVLVTGGDDGECPFSFPTHPLD